MKNVLIWIIVGVLALASVVGIGAKFFTKEDGSPMTVEEAFEQLSDPEAVSEAVEEVQEAVEDAVEQAQEAVEAAQENAEGIMDEAQEAVEDAQEAVEEAAEDAQEAVETMTNGL